MFQQNSRRYISISYSPKKFFVGQRDDFRDSLCVTCDVRVFRAPALYARDTCELKVAREDTRACKQRTLIQDCASRSRGGGGAERGKKVEGVILSRRGFPRKFGRSGSLPRVSSRAEEVEATLPAPPPSLPPLRGFIQRQTLVGTLAQISDKISPGTWPLGRRHEISAHSSRNGETD